MQNSCKKFWYVGAPTNQTLSLQTLTFDPSDVITVVFPQKILVATATAHTPQHIKTNMTTTTRIAQFEN